MSVGEAHPPCHAVCMLCACLKSSGVRRTSIAAHALLVQRGLEYGSNCKRNYHLVFQIRFLKQE